MRIISGRFKGHRLASPPDRTARPTSDKLRQMLFNIIAHGEYPALDGARIADVFAGTGALGLEALSRGAAEATFVEQAPKSLAALRANIRALDVEASCDVLPVDARRLPFVGAPFDFVFLDPPYGRNLIAPTLAGLAGNGWLHRESAIIAEAGRDEAIALPPGLVLRDHREAGVAQLLFIGRQVH